MVKHEFDKKKPPEMEKMLEEDFETLYENIPVTDDTRCGIGFIHGRILQKLANKKSYVFLYGIAGTVIGATYAYFSGTISTLEKRFKIPTRNTGIISVGNDISTVLLTATLSYIAGKGHRPRWIAFGVYAVMTFCLLCTLPHIIYGPGNQALSLTKQYSDLFEVNNTQEYKDRQELKKLCQLNATSEIEKCEEQGEGNLAPQIILFIAQLVMGIGQSSYYTLGVAYMDDNIKKSKTPALISVTHFLRMLGPAGGYALASACLKMYISPSLIPTIDNKDPRWLGAWWLGWIILAIMLFIFGFFMLMFPKELPRAVVRKKIAAEMQRRGLKTDEEKKIDEIPASFNDMMVTFKRLFKNKVFVINNVAAVFYIFGFMPYWIFTPKYIETQYKQSASTASMVTGSVTLVFSAIGVLVSGIIISKYKPKARQLAMWNVIVGAIAVFGMIGYSSLGCVEGERSIIVNNDLSSSVNMTCNSNCQCDYVKYSPVCGSDGNTYISACHAGCTTSRKENETNIYENCLCISEQSDVSPLTTVASPITSLDMKIEAFNEEFSSGGTAKPGACSINCQKEFYTFLAIMCILNMFGSSGSASNFLVSVRCVEERDKTVAMGFGLMILALFAFLPSPIFFGFIYDENCLVWGKTCTSQGNCWLYDGKSLRYMVNMLAALFVALGTTFDVGVWYYVKDLKIFDEKVKDTELQDVEDRIDENPRRRFSITA